MKIDINVPSLDDLGSMNLEQLRAELERLGPYYSKRFEMNDEDYMKIRIYVAISMMIENIENGENRWKRIKKLL